MSLIAPPAHTRPVIAAVVLAAGASRRMGRAKLALPAAGGTLLSRSVAPLLEPGSGVDRVVVVLGANAEAIARAAALPDDARLIVVVNEAWGEGMASSLRRGLDECRDAHAVLIVLADQPGSSAARVRAVIDALPEGGRLVVPVRAGVPAHPVLFARALFPELAALAGDVGAREVVRRHWEEAVRLEMPPLADVDTEEDYERFVQGEMPPLTLPFPPGGGRGDR
jgi:molybdenum cofactor cytidylyltransferase